MSVAVIQKKPKVFAEFTRSLFIVFVIVLFIRVFIFQLFNIPSGSMIPTLLEGDFVIVSKYSYGYGKYSFPINLDFSGRFFSKNPERGDVAVFIKPTDHSINLIKRIVGLPGDRIQVKSGLLFINGVPVKRDQIEPYRITSSEMMATMRQYVETLPNGKTHPILQRYGAGFTGSGDNTEEFTVPMNAFFAMGDNRNNSTDSRFMDQVGFIPIDNLVGRAEYVMVSLDMRQTWWHVWEWPWSIRFTRILHPVR